MTVKRKVSPQETCLRIVDANYNRAKEAMRVCEDIIRFSRNNTQLTKRWKTCRHDLTQALFQFPAPYQRLLESRESVRDVGRSSVIRDKKKTVKIKDLLAANIKRSQEALRVLEEFSKITAPKVSGKFQKIRFKLYDLEKVTFSKF